jgi:hypothetical protein
MEKLDFKIVLAFMSGVVCSYWAMQNNVSFANAICVFIICLIPTIALVELISVLKEILWKK